MSCICPKDFKACTDDLCRGSGTCAINGRELLERCAVCRQTYSEFTECACDRDDYAARKERDMMQVVPVWTVEYRMFPSEEMKSYRVNANNLGEVLQHFQKLNLGVNEPTWLRVTKEER